ncbi:ECF-type riboflavin transporter substrate-binding protein [Streptococcus rubneri]|uniref:ECF-type riboflavin transporter substrate-binding protein n=1 Tax=Streptococcus rubneri TaxID=1234680 RepID=UPI001C5861FD|nr:ECF-type riboflavin transporter substrate-binding protein [Streptococcus rubneri]QXW96437.1 ECF-type riboflavin transporter substrate-binding protein [Streptococcus rubneri]
MKQKQVFSIKDVVAIGVGAALFVVIAMIPIPAPAPNTSIQLQFALQALFSVIFGPIVGFLMGLIGHAIKDAMSGGLWWTWIISSGLFGLFVGLFRKQIGDLKGEVTKKELIVFNVVQVIANLLIWGLIAPVGDVLIYHDNPNKVFLQGVVAGSVNALVVAIAGSLLLIAYARTQTKDGSLSKD